MNGGKRVVGSKEEDLFIVEQLTSSLLKLSLQSSSPSHFQDANIHFLLAH